MTWSSREELEAVVVDYQKNWWRENQNALDVINDRTAHPGLHAQVTAISALGQMVTTAHIYRPHHPGTSDDRYLAERTAVHERVIRNCVPPEAADTGPPSVFFTIGCPGAGKTSVLRTIVNRHRQHLAGTADASPPSVIDADRVRQLLPEYADGRGAFVVEEECYDLTYGGVVDRAVARRADLVYDTIGRLSSIRENLELLRSAGYEIHVLHARCSLDLCRERTERRALEVDGRLVNPAMLVRADDDAADAMRAILSEGFPLAGWAAVDTTDMAAPHLIEGTAPWSELL